MTEMHDELENFDRVFLGKLRLAADVILRLGEDEAIPAPLESELCIFRDKVERAILLLPGDGEAPAAAG